ncbi:MAG: hypothetical protein JWM44_3114 [Bacilli bacterium]|nr:hypothetical protein [Bacilli bacterium]
MEGIRWIVGLPIGYGIYKLILWINFQLIFFLAPKLSFIPEFLWQLEYLFINCVIALYIAMAFSYFILPRDNFAPINNRKIRFIYWAISAWSVILMIIFGILIYQAFHGYQKGIIYQILYPPIMIFMMWFFHKAISVLDFKYNQPARDYIEQMEYERQTISPIN